MRIVDVDAHLHEPLDWVEMTDERQPVEGTADAVAICERQFQAVDAEVRTSFFAGAGDLIGV